MLARFKGAFDGIEKLAGAGDARDSKSKMVNARAAKVFSDLKSEIVTDDPDFKARLMVILVYCYAVAILEYRHRVWPYNLMDLSRRIGELWEGMCLIAWTCAKHPGCAKSEEVFQFADVQQKFLSDLWDLIWDHPNVEKVIDMVEDHIKPLNKTVNMASDKVFTRDGIVHVIDFKFSFNSNEKGNRDRLSLVGWAHKKRDPRTELLIAVCRQENNQYLETLREEGWQIVTGRATYEKIGELTGTYIQPYLDEIVDFRSDLSDEFLAYIDSHADRMGCFLDWQVVRA
ncbi:hypothetical protein HFN89_03935 [Rhizobium laguerreae]|nr:hypothetical protein [Rhizobium laguerreae]